ncbi:hypothetical protein HK405_001869 [Cladochytrium tenue]|nr:hypothetical protein HK405_001869 [Cladochytrium tenue]
MSSATHTATPASGQWVFVPPSGAAATATSTPAASSFLRPPHNPMGGGSDHSDSAASSDSDSSGSGDSDSGLGDSRSSASATAKAIEAAAPAGFRVRFGHSGAIDSFEPFGAAAAAGGSLPSALNPPPLPPPPPYSIFAPGYGAGPGVPARPGQSLPPPAAAAFPPHSQMPPPPAYSLPANAAPRPLPPAATQIQQTSRAEHRAARRVARLNSKIARMQAVASSAADPHLTRHDAERRQRRAARRAAKVERRLHRLQRRYASVGFLVPNPVPSLENHGYWTFVSGDRAASKTWYYYQT